VPSRAIGSVQSSRLGVCNRVQSGVYFRAYLGVCNEVDLAAWERAMKYLWQLGYKFATQYVI